MNIQSTRKTVSYREPVLQREAIGSKPRHFFAPSKDVKTGYVSLADPFKGGDQVVFASQPVREPDGSVKYEEVTSEVDLTFRSPLLNGLGWGAAGATVGAVGGLIVGELAFGAPGWGLLIGSAGGATLAGGLAAYSVAQEKTALVWDEHTVYQHSLKGYHQLAGIGEKDGERGFFHRFVPEVQSEQVGSYKTPRVIRYKGDTIPVEPRSVAWPKVSAVKEPEVPNRVLDVTVSFDREHLQSRRLGSMPHGYHSYSSGSSGYTECGPEGCEVAGQTVFRNMPVYEPNGDARVDAVTERITKKAASVAWRAGWAGGLGATGGAVTGALVAALAGIEPAVPSLLGAVGGAALGAVLGGRSAADDRVRLEWREEFIDEGKMVGYRESVSTHYKTECTSRYDHSEKKWEQKCEQVADGYDHRFYAQVDYWPVGSFVRPEVVHYSARQAGEA